MDSIEKAFIRKRSDWVLGVKNEDMIAKKEGDYGFDVVENIEEKDGFLLRSFKLYEGNTNRSDCRRSIELMRSEKVKNGKIKNIGSCAYFIIEVTNGDEKLERDDLFDINCTNRYQYEIYKMYNHLDSLYRLSAVEQKIQTNKRINNFMVNF